MSNRIIKFRAWNGEKMKNDALELMETGSLRVTSVVPERADYTKFTWMQFTGLLDKNGKEIYEGDVLEDKSGIKVEVKWDEERNGWSFNKAFLGWEEGQVIGNVWENGNLIPTRE